MVTANESSRRHAPKDEFPLSDLLSLEVRWSAESEIVGPSVSNETLIQSKSSLNLAGVDLDNFFADGKRDAASSASEEQLVWNRQIGNTESNDFQVREKLSLFDNIQPSETATRSIEDESGDSFSGWEANFQSADSGTPQEETKSLDPFVGNESEISSHLDTFFGPAKDSSAGNANDNMVPSASMNSGWFQDDIWGNSDLGVIGRTEQVEMTANVEDGGLVETADNYSSTNADWLQVDLGKTNSNKAPDNKTTAEDDDSLDSWNDFTSSTSALDPSNGSWNQTINNAAPSVETSEIILFSSANNSQDMDFGRFSISDFLSVGASNANGASEVKGIPPEASTSDRMPDAISKFGGDNDEEKGGVVSSARTMPSSNDVESLLSQMKDLSFMLESNLAIPQKRDGFNSSSHD